jgi:hypothetical protein
MRKALRHLALVLLASYLGNSPAYSQNLPEQATEQEVRDARAIASVFMEGAQRTRDVASLKGLFLEDFLNRKFATGTSLEDFGLPLSYRADLRVEAGPGDWESFYTAQLNLRYFMVLYFFSYGSDVFNHEPKMSELYPREVLQLIKANVFLNEGSADKKDTLETVQDLRDVTATLQKAGALMRESFLKQSPEKTKTYQERMRVWAMKEAERNVVVQPVYVNTGAYYGFTSPTRFLRVRTVPELFDLILVRIDSGLKIVWVSIYPYN